MTSRIAEEPLILHPPADLLRRQPQISRLAADLARHYATRELVSDDRLRAVGSALWGALDADQALAQAKAAAGNAVLPVIIEGDDPALARLPWETLHHPAHGFLGLDPGFALCRRGAAPAAGQGPPEKGPLRVLLFTSLPEDLDAERERTRRVYRVLHGNWRGLGLFAAAIAGMDDDAEAAFLQRLAEVEAEVQTDMALETVIARRSDPARDLLRRLPAYRTPVPIEGVVKLARDLADPPALLADLLAVSLVEQREAHDLLTREYQCSPLVAAWLKRTEPEPPAGEPAWLDSAADYQLYLFRHERRTVGQAMAAHEALLLAGRRDEADRLALDWIVETLSRTGLYATLLSDWLPPICESADPAIRGKALNQTGKQYLHTGDYNRALGFLERSLGVQRGIGDRAGEGTTLNNISQIYDARGENDRALHYLKQSLTIQQQIGDLAGLCPTLCNTGHIHWQNSEQQEALRTWVTAYRLARQMDLAKALQALEGLAGQLGLPGGLDGWEALSQRLGADGQGEDTSP